MNSMQVLKASSHTSMPSNHTTQLMIDAEDERSIMFDRDDPNALIPSEQDPLPSCGANHHSPQHVCIKHTPADMLLKHESQPGLSIRGQIDTGATASCSNSKHLFHNCREHNNKFRSPVQPCAAIDRKQNDNIDQNSGVVPEGEGHPLIPALNENGCIPARAFCFPHLTSTLTGDNCVMGSTEKDHNQFEAQCLLKFFSTSSFSITCCHKLKKSKDTHLEWRACQQQMLHSSPHCHGPKQTTPTCKRR